MMFKIFFPMATFLSWQVSKDSFENEGTWAGLLVIAFIFFCGTGIVSVSKTKKITPYVRLWLISVLVGLAAIASALPSYLSDNDFPAGLYLTAVTAFGFIATLFATPFCTFQQKRYLQEIGKKWNGTDLISLVGLLWFVLFLACFFTATADMGNYEDIGLALEMYSTFVLIVIFSVALWNRVALITLINKLKEYIDGEGIHNVY